MSRREYEIALQWVRVKYPALYKRAAAVVLTPADMFPAGQVGQCSGDNFINVSSGLTTVGAYVDTLVHELTHALQHCEGRAASEEEAYQAGIQAAKDYLREAAPWMRGKGV